MLQPLVAEARELGVQVELKSLHGEPATALAELADASEARANLHRPRRHSRVHDLLFGSVLLRLAKGDQCR